jgi:serine/threonine-protein kinase HipA
MTTAAVNLWGTTIGYVSMDAAERFARFEYDPAFAERGVELAPLVMPLKAHLIYQFPELARHSFYGLPGLLADSLPDKYGNKLIDVWLAQKGRRAESFNAVDRLCYTGKRAMGALEFEPAQPDVAAADKSLEVSELLELASLAFTSKASLKTRMDESSTEQGLLDILSVGTSAGGARAKAVIALNPQNMEIRSGQLELPPGFEHWLIKFDGVALSGDWGVADPAGYGLLEYSYYQVAQRCGINMMESRLLAENGRHHFMTRRFDRGPKGEKHFVQTLAALAHYDYWQSGYYSYEQLFMIMKQLAISQPDLEQQFRRMVFNLVGCNQDDHVKNFAFLMDRQGQWSISPAYDLCHSEGSEFTRHHQLSINGKTHGFDRSDIKHMAEYVGLPRGRDKLILDEVVEAFSGWQQLAEELEIPEPLKQHVQRTQHLLWR